MRKIALSLIAATALVALPAAASEKEAALVEQSLTVLRDLQAMPDLQVPDWLLARAEGIAILPEVIKAGVMVGGRGGTGVLLLRQPDGRWSNPLFVGIGAGSIGWQFGIQAADVVLVFTTRESIEGITDGKLTLGGDASVAAGPVGRTASAATSLTLDAEVYSYSRTTGLFAGVSLEGSFLFIRKSANERFYDKRNVSASEILAGDAPLAPAPAPTLMTEVARLTARQPVAAGAAADAASAPAAAPAAAAPATAPAAEAQTFPMADPKPGEEPR